MINALHLDLNLNTIFKRNLKLPFDEKAESSENLKNRIIL